MTPSITPAEFRRRQTVLPNCILLEMTTHCDQRCPNCCTGIGINRILQHHPWEYFEQAAKFLYGLDRVHLTGGEPTFHPQFAEFVPRFKKLFGARRLTLGTDGYGVERYSDVIAKHIDEVHYSDYHIRPAVLPLLTQIGMSISTYDGGRGAVNHVSRDRRGSGQPCGRAHWDCVQYADGKLYPCSVASGITGSQGIVPTVNWRQEVRMVALPCVDCFVSPD